ncbi:hypothetical protein SmJEL517_g01574 [Synchytrium microbalum]|uniref:uroporphyrinogen-III C-methyltransferase n=1 Tax=Synchytrium microbalum TaxID=1806994 RepID=A0A507CAZ3_9FUNG|nr:uncharacterized protein SmJEL517_g01574 [Synchytrium microbalum]TPX36349.1 hypothetical protein SmJEL517_g01574 [Synchytrium microbalum]
MSKQPGKVVLCGAGPGDIRFLTVFALQCIQVADLVIADKLINPSILNLVKGELRMAPRHAHIKSDNAQEDINTWMIASAKQGKMVVRLKTGDPFIFSRGGEEALLLSSHNIPWEYIPGVSSCIAASGRCNIPVLHRGLANQLLIVTGVEEGGMQPKIPIHDDKRTTVILMGVKKLSSIVSVLLAQGYPLDFPVAIVERGSWPDQRVFKGTLSSIVDIVSSIEVRSPSQIIVGHVVNVLNDASDCLSMYQDVELEQ